MTEKAPDLTGYVQFIELAEEMGIKRDNAYSMVKLKHVVCEKHYGRLLISPTEAAKFREHYQLIKRKPRTANTTRETTP